MKSAPVYHSNIFWHFCSRNKSEDQAFQTLCKILNERTLCVPDKTHLNDETLIDDQGKPTSIWGVQRVCFADIPFAFLKHHIGHYGNVGLGFDREYLITRGAQPLIYVAQTPGKREFHQWTASSIINCLYKEWNKLLKKMESHTSEKEHEHLKELTWRFEILRNYIKQFAADDEHSAYYEREWRIINSFTFDLADVELVIVPKKFAKAFAKQFPDIPYSITELILS